jgi:broad specificity phosphatase PhoE
MPEIRLLRHGETAGYEGDLGLSDRGRAQARDAAAALAAEAPGAVTVLYAPSVRAQVTAEVLAEDLTAAGATVSGPQSERDFANFTVAAGPDVREQAEVFGEYAKAGDTPPEELPGWLADLARFRSVHVSGGDPIALWLTTPLLGFEPPSVAVRRYWRGIKAREDALTVVAAHSGPMRALVAHAFGRDLGEPDNLEAVAIHVEGDRARVDFRGERAHIAVPDTREPAWW